MLKIFDTQPQLYVYCLIADEGENRYYKTVSEQVTTKETLIKVFESLIDYVKQNVAEE